MTLEDLALLSRRDRVRVALLVVALIVAIVWATFQFTQRAPPRRIVLASGAAFGLYHQFAQRYKELQGDSRSRWRDDRITHDAGRRR